MRHTIECLDTGLDKTAKTRCATFVEQVKKQLMLSRMSTPVMMFLLSVFTIYLSSCSKGDELYPEAQAITIDPDGNCTNDNGVMKLDLHVHKDGGVVMKNVLFDVLDAGEDEDWRLSFYDGTGKEHIITDDSPAIPELYVPGDIDAHLEVPAGDASTDLSMRWTNEYKENIEIGENIGCNPDYTGYIITNYTPLDCSHDGSVMVFEGELIWVGEEANDAIEDVQFTIPGAASWTIVSGTDVWNDANDSRTITLDPQQSTIPITATITDPSAGVATDIIMQYTSESGIGSTTEHVAFNNIGCESDCEPWKMYGESFERQSNNHCKGIAIFRLDDCDFAGQVVFDFDVSVGLMSPTVKYTFHYEDGSTSSTINMGDGDGTVNIDDNIAYVTISFTAASVINPGAVVTLTATDVSSGLTDTKSMTYQ